MTVRITHFSGTPDRNQYEARLPMLGDATWRRPSGSGTQRRLAALQNFGCDRSKADIPQASQAARSVENDPNVWSGRALQENFHRVGGCAVLHQCIRPLIGAF